MAAAAVAVTLALGARGERAAAQAVGGAGLDEPVAGPIDPGAQRAAPRELTTGAALPDVPAAAPDRVAVMAFENNSGVQALDWTVAGLPLLVGERLEQVVGLAPAWGPWVVPEGPPVIGRADAVAAFAARVDARWVVTGWVQRPNWQLRVKTTLWKVDGGQARVAAEHDATVAMDDAHALVGAALVELATGAGWPLSAADEARLRAPASKDLYAFTLVGRGLGRWLGAIGAGAVDARTAAGRDLVRAVFIEPTMAVGQRLVGELWATDPDPKVAARAAGKHAHAVELAPDYAPALRAAAEHARQTGKSELALERFGRLVRLRPWDLDARVGVGDAAWQAGDADLALRELGRVVARRPDDLRARRLLALLRGAAGDSAGLAAELEEVTRLAPDDLDAWTDLGAAYSELGRLDDATAVFTRVATARPGDATAHKRVGDVWRRRGEVERAVEWYGKMATIAPDDPRPVFLSGAALLDAGRFEEARRWFVRAQRFGPWLGQTYVALGAAAWQLGQPEQALWYWRRAAQRRPRSAVARHDLVQAALRLGQLELASGQLDVLDQLAPQDAGAAYLRGLLQVRQGDREAARLAFVEALRRDPDHADARWNLGVLGRGGDDLRGEGAPRLEHPFGDRAAYQAAIQRFEAVAGTMAGLRVAFHGHVLGALLVIGEGPGKDLKAARTAPRTCPLVTVATRWELARTAQERFLRAGVDLEEAYRAVATHDDHGETSSLGPAWRQRVARVRAGYRAAQVDVRELRAAFTTQLERELVRRGCRKDLLAAAAAQPALYRTAADDQVRARGGFVSRPPPPEPAAVSFYVDNRGCRDPLAVYIDGAWLDDVPAGQRAALQARVGRRTVCLIPQPGTLRCGDRGTVREVYLHDGWSVLMHCPR